MIWSARAAVNDAAGALPCITVLRVGALLSDPQAGLNYAALFETRSAFVHGRSLPGAISSADGNRARSLARRVVLALIDAATGPARLCGREDYLKTLA
jgi:hypothetical protein